VINEGKKFDSTRYWMYGGRAFAHKCEEIIGPRYPAIHSLIADVFLVPGNIDPRPSFLDEYLAVTGNGGGALDDYWEAFYSHPRSMGGAIWDFVSTGITQPVISLKDASPNNVQVNVMGRAKLVPGSEGKGIDLNGHDQWVEVYRDSSLEINGNKLTLALKVFPRKLISSSGTLLTKGNWQFGIHQTGKDSLEFYLTTRQRNKVRIKLPENWENNWHSVVATYDGRQMILAVDGQKGRPLPVTGNLRNTPFPVNVGRDAEIHGQETRVYICDAIIDQVRIFDKFIPAEHAFDVSDDLRKQASLWLDFEEMKKEGEFFSYGIGARTYGAIWPDRRPQPEMWQIKRSGQPVTVKLISPDDWTVAITNRYLFTNLDELETRWTLKAGNELQQSGLIEVSLPAQKSSVFRIPVKDFNPEAGKEYFLTTSFHQKNRTDWADAGYEIAWEQFRLPVYKPLSASVTTGSPLTFRDENNEVTITGKNFIYILDRRTGELTSMKVNGKELIKHGAKLNLWRAPLANETDQWGYGSSNRKHRVDGYGQMAATEWYSSGLDRTELVMESFNVNATGENNILVDVKNLVVLGTGNGAFRNHYIYNISGDGEIIIDHSVIPDGDMPSWLPRVGLQWILDKSLENAEWFGRGPQENYPDRKSGYRTDIYKSTVAGMYEPYLIPQDYGLRCDNRWVRMTDKNGAGIEFRGDKLFNFSAHPYSDDNLTKALYTYHLHPADGITLDLDYATSGVGCTARSVFPEYQVMPQRYDFRMIVRPLF
jgi:beta-galactosidase